MLVFFPLVALILLYDLFIFGKTSHAINTRTALLWTVFYVAISLGFAAFIYYDQGSEKATEFLTAYVIEKTLSVDNLFVFIAVFTFFKVPGSYHHKVLSYGIVGAIILRAIFIFSGVALIEALTFNIMGKEVPIIIVLFGIFLIYAGIKTFSGDDDEDENYVNSPGARAIRWIFGGKVSEDYDGDKFFTKRLEKRNGVRSYVKYATPLLVVVGVIEFTDLLFAVDSIPAIFSVSKDPFILYSSNIFAILGLRAMYFLLNNFMHMFRYLGKGLAVILAFIGVKMLISPIYHIDTTLSLCVVLGILILSTILSVTIPEEESKGKVT